jgi:hypothetical protein
MKMIITDRGQGASYSLIEGFYDSGIQKMKENNFFGAAFDFRIIDIVYETADFTMPLANDIETKIDAATWKDEECVNLISGKEVDFTLSKSTFTYAMQCIKRLFLHKNYPKERTLPDVETQKKFDAGHDFEKQFKNTFECAVDVKEYLGKNFRQYPYYTFEKLAEIGSVYPYSGGFNVIFEAGFCYNDVIVLVDVLERDNNENYKIYEVKNYSEIKEVTWWDLSVQYYVLSNILPNIEEFNVVLKGEDKDFDIINVLDGVKKRLPLIKEKVIEFKTILSEGKIPSITLGEQCENPYKCDFIEFCKKNKTIINETRKKI